MRKGKLIGFRKFTAKNGNVSTLIMLEFELLSNESDIDTVGVDVEKVFLPTYLEEVITSKDVGKEVVFRIQYSKDKDTGEQKKFLVNIALL